MAGQQSEGDRRILWWLITEVVVLLFLMITMVVWANSGDYYYSIYVVFAISFVFAAFVLPATAIWWMAGLSKAEDAH